MHDQWTIKEPNHLKLLQGCKRYSSPIGDICKKGIGNVKNVHEFTRRLGLLSLLIDMHVHTREESTGVSLRILTKTNLFRFSIRCVDLRITYIPVLIEKNIL